MKKSTERVTHLLYNVPGHGQSRHRPLDVVGTHQSAPLVVVLEEPQEPEARHRIRSAVMACRQMQCINPSQLAYDIKIFESQEHIHTRCDDIRHMIRDT